jgi:hypothetical protein
MSPNRVGANRSQFPRHLPTDVRWEVHVDEAAGCSSDSGPESFPPCPQCVLLPIGRTRRGPRERLICEVRTSMRRPRAWRRATSALAVCHVRKSVGASWPHPACRQWAAGRRAARLDSAPLTFRMNSCPRSPVHVCWACWCRWATPACRPETAGRLAAPLDEAAGSLAPSRFCGHFRHVRRSCWCQLGTATVTLVDGGSPIGAFRRGAGAPGAWCSVQSQFCGRRWSCRKSCWCRPVTATVLPEHGWSAGGAPR